MKELPSTQQKQTSESLGTFTQRFDAVEIPNTFSGKKIEGPEGQQQTDISELNEHLKALDQVMRDRDSSPKFNEKGEFVPTNILRDYFKKMLFEKEYAPATIFRVIQEHIDPVVDRIFDLTRAINSLQEIDNNNGGAFAGILHTEQPQEAATSLPIEEQILVSKKRREDLSNVLVSLMQRIINEPGEFGLIKKDDYNTEGVKMSPTELGDNLMNKPYSELFTKEGVVLKTEAQKSLCKRYLGTIPALKGEECKDARDIIYRMCIAPSLNRKYDVFGNEDYSRSEQEEAFSIINSETGEFLVGLEDPQTLRAYAQLIDEGTLSEGMSIDDLPVDFPVLREREPDRLKRDLDKIKDPEKRALYRLDHHRERIANMDKEDVQERMQKIADKDTKSAEAIFSTEIGIMPMYRILAFVEHILKEAWGDEYKEKMFFDFNASVLVDLNKEYHALIIEEKKMKKSEDGYDQKFRAVKRKQTKLLEGLVGKLAEWLDDDDRYTAALEADGASGGRLLLTSTSE